MEGRPCTDVGVEVVVSVLEVGSGDADAEADVGNWDEEIRVWASAMTVSARWRDCWRIEVLD